jgi:hypothetical protein
MLNLGNNIRRRLRSGGQRQRPLGLRRANRPCRALPEAEGDASEAGDRGLRGLQLNGVTPLAFRCKTPLSRRIPTSYGCSPRGWTSSRNEGERRPEERKCGDEERPADILQYFAMNGDAERGPHQSQDLRG